MHQTSMDTWQFVIFHIFNSTIHFQKILLLEIESRIMQRNAWARSHKKLHTSQDFTILNLFLCLWKVLFKQFSINLYQLWLKSNVNFIVPSSLSSSFNFQLFKHAHICVRVQRVCVCLFFSYFALPYVHVITSSNSRFCCCKTLLPKKCTQDK